MLIDLSDGILIEGTTEELDRLAELFDQVAETGEPAEDTLLRDDGVQRLTIRRAA